MRKLRPFENIVSKSEMLGITFRLITGVYVDVPNNTVLFVFIHDTLFPSYWP